MGVPLSSIRGVVPCISTGQSAGVAAALAARLNITPREVPIERLQEALRQQGVVL